MGITYNLKKGVKAGPPDAEAEYDDYATILAIKNAIECAGFETVLLEATPDLPARLISNKPDIVFNIAEGANGRGREAHVPAILNYLGIPFTGSDETTMCVTMDKHLAKTILSQYNVLSPYGYLYRYERESGRRGTALHKGPYGKYLSFIRGLGDTFDYPAIVKPNAEGSSKGVSEASVAWDETELVQAFIKNEVYKTDLLVERYVMGREFTVGVLGNGDQARVFPPMEIIFKNDEHAVYSYEIKKEFKKHIEYKCPPDIDDDLYADLVSTADVVYAAFNCRDCARIDFRVGFTNRAMFIEANPLPGLAPGYSDFPMLAEFCGVDYNRLIQEILNCALKRYGMPALFSDL